MDKLYIYGGRLVDGILMEEDDQPWHSVHRKIHNIKMKNYKIKTSLASLERPKERIKVLANKTYDFYS